jgi:hypothetical protein
MSSTFAERQFITAEEVGQEWRRLISEEHCPDSPDYERLMARIGERNDWLFEQYGKQLMDRFPGKWAAISIDGEILVRDTSGEAGCAGMSNLVMVPLQSAD